MKKLVPMAVAAVCVATVAFASVRQPSAAVNPHRVIVDTVIPQDTTITPETDTATLPSVDTTTTPTDTSYSSK